ncbi:MAG: RNA polymerase sigma factor [Gemmataceae bacterium]
MTPIPSDNFVTLLERVRQGDPNAASELVQKYEPVIRSTVRARLTDSRLRRVMDTMDICQSVMAGFFVRAAVGEYDLDEPGDLVRLLVRMTQNKIASQYRYHHRDRRDVSQVKDLGEDGMEQLGGVLPPDQIAAGREMLNTLRSRLSEEVRAIADARGLGKSWQEVADEFGGTPESRRKQLARAIQDIAPIIGLTDPSTEESGDGD